jgi:hypothetical protein
MGFPFRLFQYFLDSCLNFGDGTFDFIIGKIGHLAQLRIVDARLAASFAIPVGDAVLVIFARPCKLFW